MLPRLRLASRALLRSQSGPLAGRVFTTLPTSPETCLKAEGLQVLLRRRLRLRRPGGHDRCTGRSCRKHIDVYGDHYAACPRSGRLRRRAGPFEVAVRRVLREAGARVVPNMRLRDAGIRGARSGDAIEAAAFGLPLSPGVPIFVDITLVSPLGADGQARRGAADTDGVAIAGLATCNVALPLPPLLLLALA